MHEAAFAQAALPAPTVVLGMLLKPYSLGHELFLIRENNPLSESVGAIDATPEQLAAAALICCQSFYECKRMNTDPLIRLKLWIWRKRISRSKIPFQDSLLAFLRYRNAGCLEFPRSEIKRSGAIAGRQPGAPFLLRLHQFLVLQMRLTKEAAWDYPYGLAKMEWETYWESEDRMDVYNAQEAQFDLWVAEQEARSNA